MRTAEQMENDLKIGIWKDVIVAGGKKTYELFMPHITEFYVTLIDKEYEGDTFMSDFESKFTKREVIREFEFGKIIKYSKSTTPRLKP